jgi:hypothetical protein
MSPSRAIVKSTGHGTERILMVWTRQVLVVANLTATSVELVDALERQAAQHSVAFTLIIPATPPGGRDAAAQQLDQAFTVLRQRGLVVDGSIADGDPMVAVLEAWDPRRYDEIIVSTLPTGASKWLHADLPRLVERRTGALVTHVVAQPRRLAPTLAHVQGSEKFGVMTPLSVLSWGGTPKNR